MLSPEEIMRSCQSVAAVTVMALLLVTTAGAEEKEISEADRAEHLAHMKQVASSIRLLAKPPNPDSAAELKEEPILRYTDNTRFNYESTLWIWAAGRRPTAVVAVEYYPR